jgi:hypothetical protein
MGTVKETRDIIIEKGIVPLAKKISSYFKEPVENLGQADFLIKDLISKGLIRQASDLLNMSPADLRALRMERDRILLEAESNKALPITLKPKPEPEQETTIEEILSNEFVQDTPEPFDFTQDVIQDAPDEIKLRPQDIINAANALPSKETMSNPFFGSMYQDPKYMSLKDRAESIKRGLQATPEPKKVDIPNPAQMESFFKTQAAVGNAKQKYISNKFQLIKKENPDAIPQDYPSYKNFMIALEKEADQINAENLNKLPEITSAIPEFKMVSKTKKQSTSEFKATAFEEQYKNRMYALWQDKIPDLIAGHELMVKRLMEIGDKRFLEQVKYPVFFTNSTRNMAHIRLENSLVKLRNRRMELTSGVKLRNRNREKINEINRIIKNINDDMVALGVETRLYDPVSKKFKIYGKAFSSPKQLYDSIQEKQNLKFLGSLDQKYDVLNQDTPKYVSLEGNQFVLPEGFEEGGFASIEEVLEY